MGCFYVLGWFEYEWNQEYILYNVKCPSKEEFIKDVRNAVSQVIDELLSKGTFIGIDEIIEKILPILEKQGYRRVEFKAKVKFWSPTEGIFDCMEDEDNIKILGEDICRKIQEHNDKIWKMVIE